MHYNPEIITIMHANLWRVMMYAYGAPVLHNLLSQKFQGGFRSLEKGLYELSEVAADRSLIELATYIRILDDNEDLSGWHLQTKSPPLGTVHKSDQSEEDLFLRDFTNKVIHAERFEWVFDSDNPLIRCIGRDPDRWVKAEVKCELVLFYVGQLAF